MKQSKQKNLQIFIVAAILAIIALGVYYMKESGNLPGQPETQIIKDNNDLDRELNDLDTNDIDQQIDQDLNKLDTESY